MTHTAPGLALAPAPTPVPSRSDVFAVIPPHCFERRLSTSLRYALLSVALTVGTGVVAARFLPLTLAWTPVWLAYALVCGTFACGVWVIAHECGHGAFAESKRLQDTVGFVLHSALLVPYFSWQRSHAVHHAKTNHVIDGETHVPRRAGTEAGRRSQRLSRRLGLSARAGLLLLGRLVLGWPLYLLIGATGGAERGTTSHFWPYAPFSSALFPSRWAPKVLASTAGVAAMVGLLVWWAVTAGNLAAVVALYVGPYLVCNAWLVAYTWLHHSDAFTPHFDEPEWSYVRGAFATIDRPYGRVIDLLHHRIGSTHVVHHLSARIPHYRAAEATSAVAAAYPELYRYDATPVLLALWRSSRDCVVVEERADGWYYANA